MALGLVLIAVGWYDVFHTLLNPSGRGFLTRAIFAASWVTTRRWRAGRLVAGPGSMVVVIGLWSLLQIVGWALIYLPSFPDGFSAVPDEQPGSLIIEALYFSATTLTTLGFGDVVPIYPWIRFVAPLEALTGFALLTVAASWFIQMHAALARRRSLALRLTQLSEAGFGDALEHKGAASSATILESVAAQIADVRVDYLQTSESYYFSEADARASLSVALPIAARLAEAAARSEVAEVRMAGAVLDAALSDLADRLRELFLRSGDNASEIFTLYSSDHGASR